MDKFTEVESVFSLIWLDIRISLSKSVRSTCSKHVAFELTHLSVVLGSTHVWFWLLALGRSSVVCLCLFLCSSLYPWFVFESFHPSIISSLVDIFVLTWSFPLHSSLSIRLDRLMLDSDSWPWVNRFLSACVCSCAPRGILDLSSSPFIPRYFPLQSISSFNATSSASWHFDSFDFVGLSDWVTLCLTFCSLLDTLRLGRLS